MVLSLVKELAEKYRSEFEEVYDKSFTYSSDLSKVVQEQLQHANENIQTIQTQAIAKSNEMVKTIQNMNEPIENRISAKILSTFSWIAVMQFGIFITSQVSSYLLYPFVGLILGSFWSSILAFVLLPALICSHIKNTNDNERTTRFKLFTFALIEGLLMGYLFSHRYLTSIQPFAFLTPLAIAATSSIRDENVSRSVLLGRALGSGLLAHIAVALPINQLSFSYLFLALLYTLVAFCMLQLYLKETNHEQVHYADHLCMLQYVFISLIIQSIVFVLFGSDVSTILE